MFKTTLNIQPKLCGFVDKFWTVELKFPLNRLRSGTTRDVNSIPRDKETWRMVLAR